MRGAALIVLKLNSLYPRMRRPLLSRKRPAGPNRRAKIQVWTRSLEHAEDDGANEGECHVQGNDAQPLDWERSLGSRLPAKNA